MYGASTATERSRLGGASTMNPCPWSSDATAFQLDASAQAPWTRTIVGFGMWFPRGCSGRDAARATLLVVPLGQPERGAAQPPPSSASASAMRQALAIVVTQGFTLPLVGRREASAT